VLELILGLGGYAGKGAARRGFKSMARGALAAARTDVRFQDMNK
jgi:hypothetical protein